MGKHLCDLWRAIIQMWKRTEARSLVGLVAVSEVSKVVIVVAEMSRGCITRWTSSSSSSGIKGSNSSSREYEQRLAKRKMETQGPPFQHSYALFFSSRF